MRESIPYFRPGAERVAIALVLILLVLARIAQTAATGFTADDAFITYRYADNLARGNGFVYNIGERVQGTSSPLFTLLLAGVALVGGHSSLPAVAKIIAVLADGATLFLLWNLLSRWSLAGRFLVATFFALYPKIVFIASSGMEAPLVVTLMLGGLLALQRGKDVLGLALFGLLLLTRLDAVVWIGVCLLAYPATLKRSLGLAVLLAPIIIWGLFAGLYFGSALPNTITAKLTSWGGLYPAFDPFRVLRGYLPGHGLQGASVAVQWVGVLVMLVPVVFAAILAVRRREKVWIFPIFFLLYNLAFSFGRTVMADWYYLPGFVAAGVSIAYLVESLLPEGIRRASGRMSFASGTIFILLLLVADGFAIRQWSKNPGGWFQENLVRVGDWLAAHADAHDDIMLEPIGYIGWKSGLQVHDVIGMVSPVVSAYRRSSEGSNEWYVRYLRDRRPAFVLLQKWEIRENRLFLGSGSALFGRDEDRTWFERMYQPVGQGHTGASDIAREYVLYRRRETPAAGVTDTGSKTQAMP